MPIVYLVIGLAAGLGAGFAAGYAMLARSKRTRASIRSHSRRSSAGLSLICMDACIAQYPPQDANLSASLRRPSFARPEPWSVNGER